MHKNEKWITVHPIESLDDFIINGFIDIPAGFPNISQDYIGDPINLFKELIKHPAATHYARIRGESMKDAGISNDAILLIDGVEEYKHGNMAVCVIDGEFTIKYLNTKDKEKGIIWLMPDNPDYEPIKVTEDQDLTILGTVIWIFNKPKIQTF